MDFQLGCGTRGTYHCSSSTERVESAWSGKETHKIAKQSNPKRDIHMIRKDRVNEVDGLSIEYTSQRVARANSL